MKKKLAEFSPVTAILRGYDYEQVKTVVEVLLDSQVRAVEITLNREDSMQIIRKIVEAYGDSIAVGAGTVLKKQDLEQVIEIGADFVLSPIMFSPAMLDLCKQHAVISIPGAYSPTEIYQSFHDGADIVKVFPARGLGTKYFQDIAAPFGELPLMAVGGVNAENVAQYRKAGAKYVGIASGIFQPQDIKRQDKVGLKKSLSYFESRVKGD
ncbi:2-dehydro-3-deoxyphosphogluconate aldolase / (4S)-4-hydroxy-2-oxoglutarate aldolase [Propionispira arboris]|uniref:2-dehydro-3-deoxyphosphogluconate aldolase / (4S)-4-hydroxy-2-oxoglutarate aldolase n=1 Tax=Propionispira arboris TaxID=84035 RepID=A0A1H7ATC2_9FIRM|nr:bifunctional 4-hydroxy-2-oxoglutarate aldolase/2-dehydro-3-deoxy-phosphogluconate aldolase [Propionispira arboris]SEJ64295.1 2-dehydro-3-deoxyphosphogluconate aldolase / (4S)-4-hydroxy-2-oxoglutarate aldolase [Propionispira arboris]